MVLRLFAATADEFVARDGERRNVPAAWLASTLVSGPTFIHIEATDGEAVGVNPAASPLCAGPMRSALRVRERGRSLRVLAAATRRGYAPPPGDRQGQAAASVATSSSSASSSSSDVPGSNEASAIGSLAGTSPNATACAASESAACSAS